MIVSKRFICPIDIKQNNNIIINYQTKFSQVNTSLALGLVVIPVITAAVIIVLSFLYLNLSTVRL